MNLTPHQEDLIELQLQAFFAKRKRGRPSERQKFLARQRDLFPVELALAHATAANAPKSAAVFLRPQRSEDAKKQASDAPRFFDLRRSSTADQSGLPDFEGCESNGY